MTRKIKLDTFRYFRTAWDRRASYHLTMVRYSEIWTQRLVSAIWLAQANIPYTGEAPSMNFKGLPR